MTTRNLPIVDWLEIEASAPGKIIISGEYSVVYERQAIASAINLRTKVVIRPNKLGKVRLNLKNLNIIREWPLPPLTMCRLVSKYSECLDFNDTMPVKLNNLLHTRYCETDFSVKSTEEDGDNDSKIKEMEKKADDATIAFLLLYIGLGDSYASAARPPIDVEIESNIPVGSGLGSSSAYSVALCGALMRVFRVSAEKYIISNWAFNVDKFFHGRPSGIDNNVITYGGYILFQNFKIKATGVTHKSPMMVMLIDTGVSRRTKALCETVAAQFIDDAPRINGLFNNINELTNQIWRKINEPDFTPKNISVFLQANQELLDALGVGHEKLTDICSRAQRWNLTAKQTGAGGGGTAFVLYDETDLLQAGELREELKRAGYRVHDYEICCEGLLVSITPDPSKKFELGHR